MTNRSPLANIPWLALFLLALAIAYPQFPEWDEKLLDEFGLPVGGRMPTLFIYAILALGLNVVVGYTGILHLGIGAFFGIGAYIAGIIAWPYNPFQKQFIFTIGASTYDFTFLFACLFATFGSALLSVLISAPLLRLRGDYLALVTLGFGEVIRFSLRNLDSITNGTKGINPLPSPGFPFPENWDWIGKYEYFYYLTLGVLVLVYMGLWNLEKSRLGRAWVALREDELAAGAMGLNNARLKLSAFALGAGLAGLAGALFAFKLGNTSDPDQYGFNTSILALCCLILGGIGNKTGVLVGVLLVIGFDNIASQILDSRAQNWLANVASPETGEVVVLGGLSLGDRSSPYLNFSGWRLAIFGIVLILVMRFRPSGLFPEHRTNG